MNMSPEYHDEKPYNACLNCGNIGKSCDGPNFLAMTTERWCEWCRLRKEYLGWTNAKVAEQADIAKISVDRVMSGHVKDLRISTMQAITKVLVNGTWGQYPCAWAANKDDFVNEKRLNEMLSEKQTQADRLENDIKFLKYQLGIKDKQLEDNKALLEDRKKFLLKKDAAILILGSLLILFLILIFAALIIDRLNSDIGFFWLKETAATVTSAVNNITS